MRAYLIGHVNKFVSGLAHRRNDRHDTMTTAMQIGKTARDRADFRRCFKTGAAVFLHDDGVAAHSTYRNTLRAAQMPARTHRDMRLRATWNTNATAAHAQPVANSFCLRLAVTAQKVQCRSASLTVFPEGKVWCADRWRCRPTSTLTISRLSMLAPMPTANAGA